MFDQDAVQAILAHMNDDHQDDNLLIVRANGQPDATSARMSGLDQHHGYWVATTAEGHHEVQVAWPEPLTDRKSVRLQVVKVHDQALATLGLPHRQQQQH